MIKSLAVVRAAKAAKVAGVVVAVGAAMVPSVVAGAAPTGRASVSSAVATPPGLSTVTLVGHGYGHGIGMSQYGARAAAQAGQSATQILAAYYPGTALSTLGNPLMRIRLTALDGKPPVLLAPSGSGPVTAVTVAGATGEPMPLPADATAWRLATSAGSGQVELQRAADGGWSTWAVVQGPVTVTSTAALRVSFSGVKATCRRGSEVTFAGVLRYGMVDGVQQSTAELPMETYLRGVVPSESPASWPAASLQAQAVAARSFAAARRSASRNWDARDSTADQCWDGAAAHAGATDAAIAATAGQVLIHAGAPISAQFSASNGGWSAPGGRSYLPGRRDLFTAADPYHDWRVPLPADRFADLDGSGGLAVVTAVRVTGRDGAGDWGGRATAVVVDGRTAAGTPATIATTGAALRSALGLRSTYFTVPEPPRSQPLGRSVIIRIPAGTLSGGPRRRPAGR